MATVYYSLDFSEPRKIYYRGDYPEGVGIFDKKFDRYFSERLNLNNKVETRYVYLNYVDYMNFGFNKFVHINNNLWQVNSVTDYYLNRERSVKVELIRVENINAYLKSQV